MRIAGGGLPGVVSGRVRTRRLTFAQFFLLSTLLFFTGFFASTLLNRDFSGGGGDRRAGLTELVDDTAVMPYGDTGEPEPYAVPFQILSWKPRALYFPKFATAEECQIIVEKAKSRLSPSALAFRKGDTEDNTKGIRTSSGAFISAYEDSTGTLEQIEEKIAKATMIPRSQGEAFNILRYEIGQKYSSHYDAFDPAQYGPQKSQRMASFLLYLTDVEEGGETMFPYENGLNMNSNYDFEKCIGLKVKPRKGDGLLFYSLLTNGTIDRTSLHGSCPVIKGEKWVATKWLRDQNERELTIA